MLATVTGCRATSRRGRHVRLYAGAVLAIVSPDSTLSSLNVHLVAAAVTVISARLSSRQQRYV